MATRDVKWRPTLRLSIRVVLAVLILLTATLITINSYLSSRSALLAFTRELIDKNAEMIQLRVFGYMRPAREAAELTLSLVREGMVPAEDFALIERYFFDFLTVYQTVAMLNYGNEIGQFIMVKRQPDGSLSTKIITGQDDTRRVLWRHREPGAPFEEVLREEVDPNDPYDPRTRPWYVGAKADYKLHWTDVYLFHSDGKPGITASVPYFEREGRIRGVISVDIGLVDLSHFLEQEVRVGRSGQAFLLDRLGQVIATREVGELTIPDGSADSVGVRLRRLTEYSRPELVALGELPAFAKVFRNLYAPGDKSWSGHKVDEPLVRYRAGGADYIADLRAIDVGGRRYILGVVAAEDDFLAEARRANLRNAVMAGLLTLLALVVGGLVAGLIARSLKRLARETGRLKRLEFADETPLSSPFLEVHQALDAFQDMKTGLRAFAKYVPTTLVKTLLKEGIEPRLGGSLKEVTLFFSDIRGFTSASERMPPTELAEKLERYLSVVTDCIYAHHGTVDKYIGDGVMAFWGAPTKMTNHAVMACRAAVHCLRHIAILQRDLGDKIDCYTRIGIHTANVVIGNFGSTDRLSYTAFGDGVNIASRLEGENKGFGTQILISEDTYTQVKDHFETRKVGLVAGRGRIRPLAVYELLAEKGEADDLRLSWASRYENALEQYLSRQWQEALETIEGLRKERPDDMSVSVLEQACHNCAEQEPPEGWNGAFIITIR